MDEWDVRILTASYRRDPVLTIELYGKTRDGRSAVILYENFHPYFHVIAPMEVVKSVLGNDPEVVSLEEIDLLHESEWQKAVRITMKHPWRVPEYRNKFTGYTVLAADIPFAQRFIYDMDLGACVRVRGDAVEDERYMTDLVIRAKEFGECEPFIPPLKVLSFDIENSIQKGTIYVIGCTLREGDGDLVKKSFVGEETKILLDFVKFVQETDPDIITGYNVDGYDIPIIIERMRKLGMRDGFKIGRDKSVPTKVGSRFWRIRGRVLADAWWCVKSELKPKQETLNSVARMVLNEEKEDVDPTHIDKEWSENRNKVISYCLKDSELALRILERINVVQKYMDLAVVSKLPFDDVINGSTSTLIDSILRREADRNRVAVPMTRRGRGGGKIEGGYVHSIAPGIYHWICVLDFKSMYPSIIITKNICFTTLSPKGTIVSPTGDKFLSKDVREGLLPRILMRLMKDREEAKKRMKSAKDDEEREYYDRLQNAIKILMNAFYGVFASSFYRFTNPRIGASITAFARENIKSIINELESEGYHVIYSDTDSVFVQSPYNNLEDCIKFGESLAKRFSTDGIVLEFEKIIEPLFSHGKKKRYVGRIVWPKKDIIVRGYEIRRTDAFDLQSEALAMVFNEILDDNPEGAVKIAREIVAKVLRGDVPVEKLVISRTCRNFREYKDPDSQANVQVARKLIEMGYEFVPGMKVSWIVVDSKRTPQIVEPYIEGRKFEYRPDWEYYARRVASTLARVTEVFGWDEQSLLSGAMQSTFLTWDKIEKKAVSVDADTDKKASLEQFVQDEGAEEVDRKKRKIAVPKLTKKKLTLEDFM
ncbi:MAG: DNA polymerase II [Thermoplasmata archaeon]|nr:MAG: DNA polymerase II [Thermoplasmata archaeon]